MPAEEFNFVVYDRKAKVGGTSWWDQANTTSKLQTELGTYHLQYDEERAAACECAKLTSLSGQTDPFGCFCATNRDLISDRYGPNVDIKSCEHGAPLKL